MPVSLQPLKCWLCTAKPHQSVTAHVMLWRCSLDLAFWWGTYRRGCPNRAFRCGTYIGGVSQALPLPSAAVLLVLLGVRSPAQVECLQRPTRRRCCRSRNSSSSTQCCCKQQSRGSVVEQQSRGPQQAAVLTHQPSVCVCVKDVA